jgi:dipeptidyl aminopeptidase/acylaminoacyl peptidase
VAIVTLGALVIPAARYLREVAPLETRVEIETPSSTSPLEIALSPDGRALVFVASGDGAKRLWLRTLEQSDAHPLPGTDGADYPFWSSDGRSIGFFAANRLYRTDLAGAAPQMLAEAILGFGGSWNGDGTILFAPNTSTGIMRVPENGGTPVAVTRVAARSSGHRFPQLLPDHRHFLFYVRAVPDQNGLYLGSLDGGEPKRLTATDSAGAFLPPDRVVFERDGALVARRLDLDRGELTGDATVLTDSVAKDASQGVPGFSVSATGNIAYRSGQVGRLQLTWVARDGKVVGRAGEPDPSGYRYPELSPDGGHVALTRVVKGNTDVWIMDLSRGGFRNFTFDPAADTLPVWSGDGKRIAFTSNRKGTYDIYVGLADRPGAEELLLESPNIKVPCDWSHDNRFLLYYEVNAKTSRDLWVLDLASKERHMIANTTFEESLAQFSPNGRWIAYQTNAAGRFEVVVKAFPDPGPEWPVSTGGGVAPRWSKDGKELYFLAPDANLMAAAVTATATTFEAKPPVKLFSTRIVSGGSVAMNRPDYAISTDGRFLINQVADESPAPIKLILNVRK